jgi:glycosyltransferase involved in cell wall biosynthesis
MPDTVSVVLPALNEVDGILVALDEATATLSALVGRGVLAGYEILVVDDGSVDGTGALVAGRSEVDDAVRLLTHPVNRGVGAALRTAAEVATGDLLLYTDADMPVDLAVLEPAIELLASSGAGMVAGRRRTFDGDGSVREVGSKGYDLLVRLLLGVPERDVNFPFKLIARRTVLDLGLRSEGALIDVEVLARVRKAGLGVEQMVVDYRPRVYGSSKTMTFRLLRRLAGELVRLGGSIRADRASRARR